MKPEAYNADTICFAMGLGGFKPGVPEEGWVARMLLTPSFHPEVCLTIRSEDRHCLVEVRVAQAQIWRAGPLPQATRAGSTRLDEGMTRWLYQRLAEPRPGREGQTLILDGMGLATIIRTADASHESNGHVSQPEFAWLGELLTVLHRVLHDSGCLRGLANAGHYVGLDLPVPEASAEQPPVRLGVLGTSMDRWELASAIAATKRRPGTQTGQSED